MTSGMTQKQIELYHEAIKLYNDVRDNPWLAQGMLEQGYDDDAWAVGQSFFNTARTRAEARDTAFAIQLGATDALYRRFDQSWPYFQLLMQNCIKLFQGQAEWLRLLGLHEARLNGNGISQISKPGKNDNCELTLSWLTKFYSVVQTHPEMSAILANNNFSAAKLARDAERVTALVEANRRQDEAIAARQQAVKDRNAAFRAFKPWLRRAQKVAAIVEQEHEAQQEAAALSIEF
jgi:hypothetical protein